MLTMLYTMRPDVFHISSNVTVVKLLFLLNVSNYYSYLIIIIFNCTTLFLKIASKVILKIILVYVITLLFFFRCHDVCKPAFIRHFIVIFKVITCVSCYTFYFTMLALKIVLPSFLQKSLFVLHLPVISKGHFGSRPIA